MVDEIKLTEREIEEIKDEATFRAQTISTLKYLRQKVGQFSDVKDDVRSLKIHRTIQWGFIFSITCGIIATAFWLIRTNI